MRLRAKADSVEILSDEDGFKLCIVTDEGDRLAINIQSCAWDLAAHADQTLGAWRREGEDARATYVPKITKDDLDAYNLNDPKRISLEREMNR